MLHTSFGAALACACAYAGVASSSAGRESVSSMRPMLFMDLQDIASSPAPWGKLEPRANSLAKLDEFNLPPNINWTAGATTFAAFDVLDTPGTFEIFVAIGRPGEPYRQPLSTMVHKAPASTAPRASDDVGVAINRYTTTDFKTWSAPVRVGFLPAGSGDEDEAAARYGFEPLDGSIWTVKSMDRDPETGLYLMFASYGSSAHTFTAVKPTTKDVLVPTTGSLKKSNFKDHDDCNVFYQGATGEWVDFQIMYELYSAVGLDPTKLKKYCDNVSNDTRRVVTVRTSNDAGKTWTQDWGCADAKQDGEHCQTFNTSNLVSACDCPEDPPDLEFYRFRAFTLGASGRIVAHALDYVPSPSAVVYSPGYGRQPLWYCGHGCCHGPHSYEEWWLAPNSNIVTDMKGWRRPFKDTHAAPHDIWLMAAPITTPTQHLWIDSGNVYGIDLYRLAGLYSPGNGEFTTLTFEMPSGELWINADASWQGGNYVGGADEGRQAYIMVALHQEVNASHVDDEGLALGKQIPGYESNNCIITNSSGLQLPVAWKGNPKPVPAGTRVQLRIYFRDTTVYAVGSN